MQFDFTNGPDVLNCGGQCSNIVVHDCLSYEGQSGSAIWSTVRPPFPPFSNICLSTACLPSRMQLVSVAGRGRFTSDVHPVVPLAPTLASAACSSCCRLLGFCWLLGCLAPT